MDFYRPKKLRIPAARTAAELAIDVGVQIRLARIQRGLKQSELARLMGTTQPAVARVEKGKTLPSLDFLLRVGEALDTGVFAPSFSSIKVEQPQAQMIPETNSCIEAYIIRPNSVGILVNKYN